MFLCDLGLSLPVGHLCPQCSLVLLQLCEVPLHVLARHLQVIRECPVTLYIIQELMLLILRLVECLLRQLILVSDVVDVSL